jgi:hypothetical protein
MAGSRDVHTVFAARTFASHCDYEQVGTSSRPPESAEGVVIMARPKAESAHTRQKAGPPTPPSLPPQIPYEAFLRQLSVKGRATMEKHDERCASDAIQGHGELWKRLAGVFGSLAGHATEVLGLQTVKYYIADGKYKLQVFALEDTGQGTVVIYFPDVLEAAVKRKILASGLKPHCYQALEGGTQLHLEKISAETQDLTACKGMVGWGRKALRVELSVHADEKQVHAVERLCGLAAEKWGAAPG